MRVSHFELVRPVCPVCRSADRPASPLKIASVLKETDDIVLEAIIHCSNSDCQREYPVIDGIPLLIANLRSYVAENVAHLCQRRDLSEITESIIGDCCGPGSLFESARQHLSSYAWDHYGDLDPDETPRPDCKPGSLVRLMNRAMELLPPQLDEAGPILDAGCSVGRSSFELADRFDCPVLGIDLNFPMLRLAGEALREGVVRYPRRRVGVVYDRRVFSVDFPRADLVDFWACDATALPFETDTFQAALSMNLLDCVHVPREFLASIGSVLQVDSPTWIASPYDWSTSATAIEGWLGGHSQRGPDNGSSEPVLRKLLSPGNPLSVETLELVSEDDHPWQVRLHDRSVVNYTSHIVAARKRSTP